MLTALYICYGIMSYCTTELEQSAKCEVQRYRIQLFQDSLQFHDDDDVDLIAKDLFLYRSGFFPLRYFCFFPLKILEML